MSMIPFVYGIVCIVVAYYFRLRGKQALAENAEICGIGYVILSYVMDIASK